MKPSLPARHKAPVSGGKGIYPANSRDVDDVREEVAELKREIRALIKEIRAMIPAHVKAGKAKRLR